MENFCEGEATRIWGGLSKEERARRAEKAMWGLLRVLFPPASEPAGGHAVVAIELLENGVSVNGRGIFGGKGRLLKFVLVMMASGVRLLSGAWGWAFHRSRFESRFHGVKSDVKKELHAICPMAHLQIVEDKHARRGVGDGAAAGGSPAYHLVWGHGTTLVGAVFTAQTGWEAARDFLEEKDVVRATRCALKAVQHCPLLLPPYVLLTKCMQHDDARAELQRSEDDYRLLLYSMREYRSSLRSLENQLDFERIPQEHHGQVSAECLAELSVSRDKLTALEEVLAISCPSTICIATHPLNTELERLRELDRDDTASACSEEALAMKSEAVMRLRKLRILDSSRRPDHEVDVALLGLAGDPGFSFPEPTGKEGRWRERSVKILIDIVRGTARKDHDYRVDPFKNLDDIPDASAHGRPDQYEERRDADEEASDA